MDTDVHRHSNLGKNMHRCTDMILQTGNSSSFLRSLKLSVVKVKRQSVSVADSLFAVRMQLYCNVALI